MRGQAWLIAGAMLALTGCGKAEAPAPPEAAAPEKSVLADGPAAEISGVAAADLPPGVRSNAAAITTCAAAKTPEALRWLAKVHRCH